jgi:hypothetical protein
MEVDLKPRELLKSAKQKLKIFRLLGIMVNEDDSVISIL